MPSIVNPTKSQMCERFPSQNYSTAEYLCSTELVALNSTILDSSQQVAANRSFGLVQGGTNYYIQTNATGVVTIMETC